MSRPAFSAALFLALIQASAYAAAVCEISRPPAPNAPGEIPPRHPASGERRPQGNTMKVLLVATNREFAPLPVAPIGALCVTAAARAAGHDVQFLDLGTTCSPKRSLQKALVKGAPEVVAFSIRNLDNCSLLAPRSYFEDVRELAESVRRSFAGPLILGGSGFSVSPRGWLRRLDADAGVVGEGERAFVELLARLETGRSLEGVAGVITKKFSGPNGAGNHHGAAAPAGDWVQPAHELCRYGKYLRRGGAVSVQTKRGCPFACAYCIYPHLEGRRYRLRPPESVVDEIEAVVKKSGARHFFFVDSVFNDPREHALAICSELRRRKLPMGWMAFCNPLGFDAELARTMAESGCQGLEFGLDTATPKMLAAMHKPFGQAEIRSAMQAARDAGLPLAVHLLCGGPGETWADVEDTQKFLNSCAPANGVFASLGIRVHEGTPMEKIAAREGVLSPEQDLFEPAYYLSPAMTDRTEEHLDRIARRRPEWSSPVDWRRPVMRWIQLAVNRLDVRPQWRDVRNYGLHMRGKTIP
jgi:radical SAM superfamily enzyme YgiQ (UPF0313 family)